VTVKTAKATVKTVHGQGWCRSRIGVKSLNCHRFLTVWK
jgi:hypothetical protein